MVGKSAPEQMDGDERVRAQRPAPGLGAGAFELVPAPSLGREGGPHELDACVE